MNQLLPAVSRMNGVKRYISVVVATTVIASLAVVGLSTSAGASVARYQIDTLQYTMTVQGGYTHSYTVYPDPCGNTFTGTGQYPAFPAVATVYETVSGSTDASGNLTFTGAYFFDPLFTLPTGYVFTFTGMLDVNSNFVGTMLDNDGNATIPLAVTGTLISFTSTNYKNHGDYVNSVTPSQRAAAAKSCVGMPIQSQQ